MKIPLFLVGDGNDVEVFHTKEELERYLEPTDVRNGVYKAFDFDGNPLRLEMINVSSSRGKGSRLFGFHSERVSISEETETPVPPSEEGLKKYLCKYLIAIGRLPKEEVSAMPLPDLIRSVIQMK